MAFPQGTILSVTAQSGLYLRSQPSVQAGWVAAMPFGSQVVATGNEQNGFSEVVYQNAVTGWAASQFLAPQVQQVAQQMAQQAVQNVLQPAQQNMQPVSTTPGTKLYITGQDVFLRAGPMISNPSQGPGSNVIFSTNKGETAIASGPMQNGFTMVTVRGQEGWMATQYLSADPVVGIVQARPQPPAPVQPNPITPVSQPQPKPAAVGTAGFVLGLGILVAVGYFMMK